MAFIISNFSKTFLGFQEGTQKQKTISRRNFSSSSSFYGKNFLRNNNFKKFRTKKEAKWLAVFGPGGGFFGVGTSELIVIGAVAWLVLGPKRLYQLARDIGKISGEIKNVAEEARQTFQQAIDIEGLENDSQIASMKNNGQEDNTASKSKKKKKAMKSLDEMVKTDISKNETGKD
jgi:Tat protein translocase TatB subunit